MTNQELENETQANQQSENQQSENQQSPRENLIFKKVKVFFEENLKLKPLDVSIAIGIHATILSIITGLIIAYGLYQYGKSQELQNQLFQEAAKINLISLNATYSKEATDIEERKKYDTSDQKKREEVLQLLKRNGWRWDGSRGKPDVQRGYKTLFLLSVLYTHHPFADNDAPKITFNSIDQVKSWVEDLDKTTSDLLETLYMSRGNFQEDFNEIPADSVDPYYDPASLDKFKDSMPPEMYKEELERRAKMRAQILEQSTYSLNEYAKPAIEARELVTSVKSLIAQNEAHFVARKSSKNSLIIGLIVAFLGFLCGVLIPMINKEISPIIFLIVPIILYCFVFFYTFYIITLI